MGSVVDTRITESEKRMESVVDARIAESENLLLEEMDRLQNNLMNRMDRIDSRLDSMQHEINACKMERKTA